MPVEQPIYNNDGTVTYKGKRYFKDYFDTYRPDLQDNKPVVIVDKTGTREQPVLLLEVVVTPRETLKLSPNYPIYTISSPGPNENAPYGYYNIGGGYGAIGKWIPITEEMYSNGVHDGLHLTEMSDPADNALNWLMAGGLGALGKAGIGAATNSVAETLGFETLYPYLLKGANWIGGNLGTAAASLALALGLVPLNANAIEYDPKYSILPAVNNEETLNKFIENIGSEEELEALNLSDDLLKLLSQFAPEKDGYSIKDLLIDMPYSGLYFTGKNVIAPIRDYNKMGSLRHVTATPVEKIGKGYYYIDANNNTRLVTKGDSKRVKHTGKNEYYVKGKLDNTKTVNKVQARALKHPTVNRVSKWPWLSGAIIGLDLGKIAVNHWNDAFSSAKKQALEKLDDKFIDVAQWAKNIVERHLSEKFKQQMLQDKEKAVQEKIDSLPITVTKSNDSVLATPDSTGGKPATPGRFTQQVDSVN